MKKIKAEYTGNGAFYRGIPARDLTVEEWEALDKDSQDMLKKSSIYTVLSKPKTVEDQKTADESGDTKADQNQDGNGGE